MKKLTLLFLMFLLYFSVFADTISVVINNNADDGTRYFYYPPNTAVFDSTNGYAGCYRVTIPDITDYWAMLSSFFRWDNITIPGGANITTANITVKTGGANIYTGNLTIQGDDEDNANAVANYTDWTDRAKTTATANWLIPAVNNTVITSSDIASVIQEIIDRGGWSSGNAIQLFLRDRNYPIPNLPPVGYGNYYTNLTIREQGYNATLQIDYTPSGGYSFIY